MADRKGIYLKVSFRPIRSLKNEYEGLARRILGSLGKTHAHLLRQRYLKFSQHGGSWPELAERTKKERMAQGYHPTTPILIRTNTLLSGLNYKVVDNYHYVVGWFTPSAHPDSKLTVTELAEVHHYGRGRVPSRTLLEDLTARQQKALVNAVKQHFGEAIRNANRNK